jgi:hypothetical protein
MTVQGSVLARIGMVEDSTPGHTVPFYTIPPLYVRYKLVSDSTLKYRCSSTF